MNRFGKQRRTTEEMYRRTDIAAKLSEHDKKHTDLRIDKQKHCNFGRQKIDNSRQETGFSFVIQVKDVFIQEIQVSCSYF